MLVFTSAKTTTEPVLIMLTNLRYLFFTLSFGLFCKETREELSMLGTVVGLRYNKKWRGVLSCESAKKKRRRILILVEKLFIYFITSKIHPMRCLALA